MNPLRPAHARPSLVPSRRAALVALACLAAACGGKEPQTPGGKPPVDDPGPTGPPAIASVKVTRGDSLILIVGTVDSVKAEVKDSEGTVVSRTVTWNSSNTSIVTVDQSGVLRPVALGKASVSASTDGVTGSIGVSVEENRIAETVVIADDQKVTVTSDTTTLAATGQINLQTSAGAAPITSGTVLNAVVQGRPILRMVESATTQGNQVVAQTRPATIADAVDAGAIGYVQTLASNGASTAPMLAAAQAGTVMEGCIGGAQSALRTNIANMAAAGSPFTDDVSASYSAIALPLAQNLAGDVAMNADGSWSPAGANGAWVIEIPIPNNKGIDITFQMKLTNARASFVPTICFLSQLNKDVSTVAEVAQLAAEGVDRLLTRGKLPKVRLDQLRFTVGGSASFDADVETSIRASRTFSASDINLGSKLQRVKSLACPTFPWVTVPVGPIVLAFRPVFCINLIAELSAAVEASMKQTVHLDNSVYVGTWYAKWDAGRPRYFKELPPYTVSNVTSTTPMVSLKGDLGAKVGLKPEVGLYLYDVAGPYFNVEGGAEAEAYADLQGWGASVQGYLDAGAGIKLKIPVIEETLADIGYVWDLWESDVLRWQGKWAGPLTSPLSLDVSPAAEQSRDWNGTATWTISATSNGIGVAGVSIPYVDPLTNKSGTFTTGSNGQVVYTTTVPSNAPNATHTLTFGPATRTGYETAPQVARALKVAHPTQALKVGVCMVGTGPYCGDVPTFQPGFSYSLLFGADAPPSGAALCGVSIPVYDPFTRQTTTKVIASGTPNCLSSVGFSIPAGTVPGPYTFRFGPATATGYLASPVAEFTINVAGATASIRGTVTAGGGPLGDVILELFTPLAVRVQTRTAADGTYAFDGLSSGFHSVTMVGGYDPALYAFSTTQRSATLAAGGSAVFDFQGTVGSGGPATATVAGTVRVAGAGVGGVPVTLSGAGTASTRTAADGTYGFVGLSGGAYQVSITPDAGRWVFSTTSRSVTATVGQTVTADFEGSTVSANLAVASVRVSPPSATIPAGATVQLTAEALTAGGGSVSGRTFQWLSSNDNVVSVDANGLVRGVGEGTAAVTASVDGIGDNAIITVSAQSGPFIGLGATSVPFSTKQGSSPAAKTVAITNGGSGTLSGLSATITYPAGQANGWLAASLNATTAPATLTLTASSSALAAGTYGATVAVAGTGASNSPALIQVTLTVEASVPSIPIIGLASTSVQFKTKQGSSPTATTVGITNTGAGTLSGLGATITYAAGQASGWLAAGLSATTAPATLTLTPSGSALAVGTYGASVAVTGTGASNSPALIAVTLTVEATGSGTAPTVAAWSISEGVTDVSIGAAISATFSAAMDPATLTTSTFTITGPSGPVAGAVTWDAASLRATFTPTNPLQEFRTGYTATIGTGVKSAAGVTMAAAATRSFTTVLVDAGYWYRITNRSAGDGSALDTYSGTYGCHMSDATVNYSGQSWNMRFVSATRYGLRNQYGGDNRYLEGGTTGSPCLLTGTPAAGGYFGGQIWQVVPLTGANAGWFRLGSDDDKWSLDLTSVGPNIQLKSDAQSQQWKFARLGKKN